MSKKSKLTLIVDGNWLLMSRFSVISMRYNSDEEMCKELQLLMLKSVNRVLKTFPDIDNLIFVSDGGSWRANLDIPQYIYNDLEEDQPAKYKGQRHLDEQFNWDMIFAYYENLIEVLSNNKITTCRVQNIEGDDWCWYWSTKLNQEGSNVIIWSMDKDLTQLVRTNDQTGVFTVCWNDKTGLTCEKKDQEEDPIQFFFNDLSKENNNRIFDHIANKCKNVNPIVPKEVIIDKIIRGDKGDNIFPIILKKAKNEETGKKFRVSTKDIDFNLNLNNEDDVKNYIHNLVTSKKYFGKINNNKSEEDICDHFKYNYKLVTLTEENYPEDILESMNSYIGYSINNSVAEPLAYLTAKNSNMTDILDNI